MSNIFAEFKSGDIDPSSLRPSYKVSDLIGKDFRITFMKRLEGTASIYSDAPTMLVNAKFTDIEDDEGFVFFAPQKVLFDKLSYILSLINSGKASVYEVVFRIIQRPTKDGKANYYDLIDVTEDN